MKAVVMAGGEGTRLRPVTCTRPKPMIKIMGKPVIGYIIDLLIKNGFDEIAVTSRYRSEDIEEYTENLSVDADIYCIEEESILGTAGSVKNAAKNWNEPFVVISGDCICDIELSKVMLYHKSIMADVTIVCSSVEEPGEYGTVNLTRNGSVDSFCEKPDWSHCSSDLANTGVYVINPVVLDFIPDNLSYDFANDLFPVLMNEGKRLYGYQTENYWCDIGSLSSIRKCIRDLMANKVNIDLPDGKNGVFVPHGYPSGNFDIIPPVYFGKNVTIGNNSTIGPFSVVEDNVIVGDNTRIKKSVIMSNSHIGGNCDIIGSVVGEKCLMKRNSICLEGSCLGDGCTIESGSTVSNNVSVWPEKHVPYRSVLKDNLRDGKSEFELITSDGICGTTFSEMSPERCCRLGEALGSSSCGGKVGIGYDSTREAKTLAMAILSGLISGGSQIFDFGECFESQMGFFVSYCSLDSGIFISANAQKTEIRLFGEYGLPLLRRHEREVESRYKRNDFRRACGNGCNEIKDMSAVSEIYDGQLLSSAGDYVSGACATIRSKNKIIKDTADKCFYWLGCYDKALPEFSIDYTGRCVVAKDEENNIITHEKLIGICASDALKNGNNICVPFDAPSFIDALAEKQGKNVYRIGKSSMTVFDEKTAVSAGKNMWAYDALSLVFTVLKVMSRQNRTLNELVMELPEFNMAVKTISCNIAPSKLACILGICVDKDTQGLRKELGKGYVTVSRTGGGRHIRIVAEAGTMEAANEICVDTQKKITSDTIDNKKQ